MTPGRNGSMRTSAREHSRLATSAPLGFLRSMTMDRLPRARISTVAVCISLSTRVTVAPKSARIIPAYGTGASPAISTTLIPARAAILKPHGGNRWQGMSQFSNTTMRCNFCLVVVGGGEGGDGDGQRDAPREGDIESLDILLYRRTAKYIIRWMAVIFFHFAGYIQIPLFARALWARLLESVLNLTNGWAKLTTKIPLSRNTPGHSKVLL